MTVDIGRKAWGHPCPSCDFVGPVFLLSTMTFVIELRCPECDHEWMVDTTPPGRAA